MTCSNLIPVTTLLLLLLFVGLFTSGCATKGVALRPASGGQETPPSKSNYIQSDGKRGPVYSCSFVEFDERGDYLDFNQHIAAWQKIRDLGSSSKLLMVTYCHGWKNNSQSANVVEFNQFLSKLAASEPLKSQGVRVHGLYLSWRGNQFQPYIDENSEAFRQTTLDFGAQIVSADYYRRWFFPLCIPETLTYWSRKKAAETKVSSVPIARTIFTTANIAKRYHIDGWTNQVVVMGHSFGALMLEKSLGQACIGAIINQWTSEKTTGNSLPFDCILFVNSAAPSIHSKLLSDFLWADHTSHKIYQPGQEQKPIVISVTSSADWATRYAHRYANILAPFDPSLQRQYHSAGLLKNAPPSLTVPQSYFYEHTPGHNPLLVDHWIVLAKENLPADVNLPANDAQAIFESNLNQAQGDKTIFFSSAEKKNQPPVIWKIGTDPDPANWSKYEGYTPDTRGNYWIIRCNKRLISSHTAIWTPQAMELYAALYRLTR